MENTLENKAKFFAQYWGQSLKIYPESISILAWPIEFNSVSYCKNLTIELKPLSSITDEDAIKISLMFLEMESAPYENVLFCFKNSVKPLLDKVDKLQARITDYLRSKGYALPYMGLSVETMVEYGWIKLTS